ncbi:hypothetical protein RR46_01810 [Papilio xuthus]|uniref:Uncharacterized protein n=1 Tax=Papilio xuthus TaxID=66420 RepID=A0A194QH87_PAPXU|nr:hypothetical protein RR46_01810 [Papilio xuthus]
MTRDYLEVTVTEVKTLPGTKSTIARPIIIGSAIIRPVAPKHVYEIADMFEEERKKLEAAAPKKKRASELLRETQK